MIVVTGGAGFIGSAYVEKLNREGVHDILIVDRLGEGGKWKNLVHKSFRAIIEKDDFLYGLEDGTFDGQIEAVVHLGACSSTTERNADYLLENNYRYSIHVAEYCMEHDVRLVYASSAATYGSGSDGYDDTVFEPLTPLNMYGYSKHLFDLWVRRHGYESRMCGLKFFNVFGPNEYHKDSMASMVFKAYSQITATGKVQLFRSFDEAFEDGGQKRDFVYVKDVCDILWKIQCDSSVNGIFNLGTGEARTWNELVLSVFASMKVPAVIDYVDMPESLRGQYQNFTQASMGRLQATSASHRFRPLEDSVGDYVERYLSRAWQHL
ncbi:MAG: ADP-glyceromanno-heptose 6-epimerase [Candidatus Kapaibacterium sp.]